MPTSLYNVHLAWFLEWLLSRLHGHLLHLRRLFQ